MRELRARDIEPDASQRSAILAFLELLRASAGRKWWRKSQGPLGVYCHGLPGRGKSVVVDTIFSLADCPKRRIHFHEFLHEIIRRQVSAPAKDGDRLVANTREWLSRVELLCFDEFHVHHIADAFLIGRFLETALSLGVRVVLTSNYAPDGLYVHGIAITDTEVSDSEGLDLVMPVQTPIAKAIADGAYYSIERVEALFNTGVLPVIPPPSHSVVHGKDNTTWHDALVQYIQEKGIYAFHKKYGYGLRSLVEVQISRIKRCISSTLKTQKIGSQKGEGVIIPNILNLWNSFGRPASVKTA